MSLAAGFTLLVVAGTIWALVRELTSPAITMLGAVILLLVAGVIDADQAFAGFSNEAPIIVAALLVLARAAELSGVLQPVIARLLGDREGGRAQLARVIVPTALSSALLNNTTIVAMTVPPVVEWANRRGVAVSRFLIPLSYAAVLGGVITAIGTSTNLVVSGLLVDAGMPALGLFELAPAGLPIALAGAGVLVMVAPRLLPDRRGAGAALDAEGARQFSVSMQVIAGGPLPGRSVADAGLRHLQGVFLVQITRAEEAIAPVGPDVVLQADDVLTFVGKVDQVVDLQRQRGLRSAEAAHLDELGGKERAFYEVVVGEDSPLVGQTLKDASFRSRYQAAVLAIHRAGQHVEAKLGDVPLRVGDTLLLLGDPDFRDRWRDRSEFLLIAPLSGAPPASTRTAPIVGLITVGLLVATGTGLVPLLQGALVTAGLLLVTRCVTVRQARSAIDIDLLVLIAASFGLGAAVSASGLADSLAGLLSGGVASYGPVVALACVLIACMALTELISNNAAAALMFPIAVATAESLGVDPRPFVIAITFGASLSFLTPIGYQTNLMVYGIGGYRFTDFTRVGIPLNLVCVVLTIVLIPPLWPF